MGIAWIIAAIVLACLELLAGEFTFLMLAGGALAGAALAFCGLPTWVPVAGFTVVSLGLLFFLRPVLRKKMTAPLQLDTSAQALVGATALVVEAVSGHQGQIRLDGALWSARSIDPRITYQPGSIVSVASIDGATAIVWKES